jgi:diguanylate cyclase (GGDEF)-like protein
MCPRKKEEPPVTQNNLRILIAESAPWEAAASLRVLYPENQSRLELTVIGSITTLIPTIHLVNPEVVLLDLSLAHPDPLEFVRKVRRAAPEVGLIVFADPANKQLAVRCIKEGALDYLLKGFMDPPTLERAIRTAIERNTIEGLADLLRDPVTLLHTREGFLTLGMRTMETASRNNSTLVLLCVRIENLPYLREEHGASAVEGTLKKAARLLSGCFRATDLVARIGESQFAALAADAAEPSAPVLLQRVEKRMKVQNHESGPWGPLELQRSVGFWSPEVIISFPEFLDRVEAGLRAKPGESETTADIRDAVAKG